MKTNEILTYLYIGGIIMLSMSLVIEIAMGIIALVGLTLIDVIKETVKEAREAYL